MRLSIVIAVLNDLEELRKTIESIRSTSPANEVEIVVVDDMSTVPVPEMEGVRVLTETTRLGVGGARHLAAAHATGEFLLITDAHMRFEPGWYEAAISRILHRPTTMHCGVCLGLDKNATTLDKNRGAYQGASLCFYHEGTKQVLEGKWLEKCEDDEEIPCVMGASYFIPRLFFYQVGGLNSLKMWGSDEPYLSLKVWMAGGDVRMLKTVRIGHMFRDNAPYSTDIRYLVYNKIRMCMELFDDPLSDFLISKLPQDVNFTNAMAVIRQDLGEIEAFRKNFKPVRDVNWFIQKFKVSIPGYTPPESPKSLCSSTTSP